MYQNFRTNPTALNIRMPLTSTRRSVGPTARQPAQSQRAPDSRLTSTLTLRASLPPIQRYTSSAKRRGGSAPHGGFSNISKPAGSQYPAYRPSPLAPLQPTGYRSQPSSLAAASTMPQTSRPARPATTRQPSQGQRNYASRFMSSSAPGPLVLSTQGYTGSAGHSNGLSTYGGLPDTRRPSAASYTPLRPSITTSAQGLGYRRPAAAGSYSTPRPSPLASTNRSQYRAPIGPCPSLRASLTGFSPLAASRRHSLRQV